MTSKDGVVYCLHDNNEISQWDIEVNFYLFYFQFSHYFLKKGTFIGTIKLPEQYDNSPILNVSVYSKNLILVQEKVIHIYDTRVSTPKTLLPSSLLKNNLRITADKFPID